MRWQWPVRWIGLRRRPQPPYRRIEMYINVDTTAFARALRYELRRQDRARRALLC
jgi:hypothetical protein